MKTLVVLSVMLVSAAAIGDDRAAAHPEQASAKAAQAKFESLDRNNDRALNKIEARAEASLAAKFASVDVNADGFISQREYVAYVGQQPRSN